MALTYRTGSDGKGSALTIEELDNNFRYFTGSHSVTGSFEVSGSIIITGSLNILGSITTTEDTNLTGSFTGSFDGIFTGSIDGTNFNINNLPTSEPAVSGQLWLSGSFSNSKYLMVRD
tara:strand:- start:2613 stop:2966 length:354 start_codon:yes stop_codon:yes gene_type:complete